MNKEKTTNEWIKEFLEVRAIKYCPRCGLTLISNSLYSYLERVGVEQGRAHEIVLELEELGINCGYLVHADIDEHYGDPETDKRDWCVCSTCFSEGVSQYESSENWPIEAER